MGTKLNSLILDFWEKSNIKLSLSSFNFNPEIEEILVTDSTPLATVFKNGKIEYYLLDSDSIYSEEQMLRIIKMKTFI